jgi:hypothetical protein
MDVSSYPGPGALRALGIQPRSASAYIIRQVTSPGT